MRNIPLKSVDDVKRDVLAIGTDYLPNILLNSHLHRRAQFLYGATGLIEVSTADGEWVIPPDSGVWIPENTAHETRMLNVSTRSLYIEPTAAPRQNQKCEVLRVSPLLRQLLLESVDMPIEYDLNGRDGVLIQLTLHEIARAAPLPFYAPIPRDANLAKLCREFLKSPKITSLPHEWAEKLHKSERSFSRFFGAQTGLSFSDWRQQACLLSAITHISAGKSITEVAFDLGYNSVGSFSTMFKKWLGQTPSSFIQRIAQ
ncbi:helix-turn-helix transcriptional regulator [Citrobacter sp. Cpo142]|uniref:AraC family transcriptional regulator n=1 Tax=Citrobacter sp. Cpo142 TaxID=2985151 RepID=UPI00257862F3|nr:helix-turn-helix transcriptional regulator [Citrobacter sp. Cpo142]EFN7983284.1 AraC family transcriptional regulator [Escherichia coli]MDM2776802.1 helix-turn-helix transcriptional regulator [Citrobacter sp. Cpo142]